jgi:hypothetical protein
MERHSANRPGDGQMEEPGVPPATEELHLPGPSYLPVIVAFGITLAIVGVVISYFIVAAGLIITVVGIVRWVRETREDMAELPLEH